MNMEFYRKLPIPMDIKKEYPVSDEAVELRNKRDRELKDILAGRSEKLLLIIGPCSADREDAVLEYLSRLKEIEREVSGKIFILPRLYTNKPRSKGNGYMGMLHQPDPNEKPDLLKGIVAIRKLYIDALEQVGFSCADEMLYPENHRYLSDLLGYAAVGARSVEDQQHRLVASGLDIPVGMKNPTWGDLPTLMNSIGAAQKSHIFLYRGWEVKSHGNPYAHAILRGYTDSDGRYVPNYGRETLEKMIELYAQSELENPAVIIDTNHANSGKDYLKQTEIALETIKARRESNDISRLVKGLMIESYLEDGAQKIGDDEVFGCSITDPCLGWDKTKRLILTVCDRI